MIGVTGYRTTIVQELAKLVSVPVFRLNANLGQFGGVFVLPDYVDHFVLAAGVLRQAPIVEQSSFDVRISLAVNLVSVVRLCEVILAQRPHARICVIGSESGFKGSFDETYAMCKAAIHAYVTWKTVTDSQSLMCIAPPIIRDSGMTYRRNDYPAVIDSRRTVTAREVAEKVKSMLFDEQYLGCAPAVERM